MINTVYDNVKALFSIRPVTATATQTGTGVDTLGYGGDAMVTLEVGTVSGTSPTLNVKIQESDDNSSFSDITGATFTQVTATGNSQVLRITNLNSTRKRYLRAVGTIAGTSPSFAFGVEFLLGNAYSNPVN